MASHVENAGNEGLFEGGNLGALGRVGLRRFFSEDAGERVDERLVRILAARRPEVVERRCLDPLGPPKGGGFGLFFRDRAHCIVSLFVDQF